MNPEDKPAASERRRAAEALRGLPALTMADAEARMCGRTSIARSCRTRPPSGGWRDGASWSLRS